VFLRWKLLGKTLGKLIERSFNFENTKIEEIPVKTGASLSRKFGMKSNLDEHSGEMNANCNSQFTLQHGIRKFLTDLPRIVVFPHFKTCLVFFNICSNLTNNTQTIPITKRSFPLGNFT
jgi:hypothetical protein